jgi:hypothetical protein
MMTQKYNTIVDFKEGKSDDANLIQLLQDRVQWWARVNTLINVLVT